MACCLFGAKPLSKQMLGYLSIGPLGTNFSETLVKNTKLFIHENGSENIVYEAVVIVSSGDELNEKYKEIWKSWVPSAMRNPL